MARMVNEMKKNFTVVHNQFLQDPELGIAEKIFCREGQNDRGAVQGVMRQAF